MKKGAKPKPVNREITLAIDRIRAADRPIATQFYVAAGELAKRLRVSASDVLETFAELAHVGTYDGTSPADAERRAWLDTVAIFERRSKQAA